MGLISGFFSGAGNAMGEAGKMMFADKLSKERAEADYLRSQTLGEKKMAHESDEKQKDRDAALERTKYSSDKKTSDGNKPTSQMKNAAALRAKGYPKEIADAAAHGSFEEVKDADTGDMVLINTLTNKPVGRLTTVGNKKQWVPEGEVPENAEVTSSHRKTAKKSASKKAEWFSTDATDFPSTGGDRKAWSKEEAQRLANDERAGKTGGGIVSNQMTTPETPKIDPAAAKEMKMINNKEIGKEEYIDAMIARHGEEKRAAIEKKWASYK